MYRTCVVHAPIPCTVIDEEKKLYMVHDRYLTDWEYENGTDQEEEDGSEDGRGSAGA